MPTIAPAAHKHKFSWIDLKAHPEMPKSFQWGGCMRTLCFGGRPICDYIHWGFACCGLDIMQNFKSYHYQHGVPDFANKTNCDILNENVEELVKFIWDNSLDTWKAREVYMLLSSTQINQLHQFLQDPHIKLLDKFTNKAHGPCDMHLYRLSTGSDFKQPLK
jgi:hypothetical protein